MNFLLQFKPKLWNEHCPVLIHLIAKSTGKLSPLAKRMLEQGIGILGRDIEDRTVLHVAASKLELFHEVLKHVQIAKAETELLNAEDTNSRTALHTVAYSSSVGRLKIAQLLLQAGANPNVQDQLGHTPLVAAISEDSNVMAKWVKLFLRHKANPNIPDRNGTTPIKQAIFAGDMKLTEFLLNHGADLNIKDKFGMTPLMCLARYHVKRPYFVDCFRQLCKMET